MPDWASDDPAQQERHAALGRAFMEIYGNPLLGSDPHRLYEQYRLEPARRMGPMLLLSSRSLVDEALRQPTELSSGMASAQLGNVRPLIPMQVDPPDHAKYRRLLDPLFSRKALQEHEAFMTELADSLIEPLVNAHQCDFIAQVAAPYPARVLMYLMGLPEGDLDLLQKAKDGIVHPPRDDMARAAQAQYEAGQQLYRYFEQVVQEKREAPDNRLISNLLTSSVDGRALSTGEIVDVCYVLLLAGLDTVTDSLGLGWAYLAQHPSHQSAISADPTLIPTAIDEILRYESPIPGVPRIVTRETQVGGCPVAPGDVVYISLGAANADDTDTADAAEFRINRAPNRHLAFGGGIHRCLGSHLAKLQLGIVMRQWHHHIPHYQLQEGTVLEHTPGLRSVVRLPLTF